MGPVTVHQIGIPQTHECLYVVNDCMIGFETRLLSELRGHLPPCTAFIKCESRHQ